jgi:hypothetical protein
MVVGAGEVAGADKDDFQEEARGGRDSNGKNESKSCAFKERAAGATRQCYPVPTKSILTL